MELLLLISALKRASAAKARITLHRCTRAVKP
jgi:phosphoribosylpyrophosphate synthetase